MSLQLQFSGLKNDQFYNADQNQHHFQQFLATIQDPNIGFFQLPKDQELVKQCRETAKKFSSIEHFVHVGIGGSSLGTETLISALKNQAKPQFHFINNIDPDAIASTLAQLDPHKSLFYFVSKSGGTAETMAAFAIIANWLKPYKIHEAQFKERFVFATDPKKSDLLELAKQYNISTLTIPSNVGGRFSALTPVGLFPAIFAGIDVQALLDGAKELMPSLLDKQLERNPLAQAAAFIVELKQKYGVSQTVFMPYSSKLRDLSFWFVQLWAESLGKRFDLDGNEIQQGLTPIPAYGATDQHSQMQLFMEGPKDKCMILIEVEQFHHNYKLSNDFKIGSLQKLASYNLQQLMQAEFRGTKKALEEAERFILHLTIPEVNAKSLGQLILFFESLTTLVGNYLHIDPFDQPGVEAGKRYAFEWLAKQG